MKQGLLIGRFQPFHLGHLEAIRFALERVDMLWIVIGSAQKSHEPRNPFTAAERLLMIRDTLYNTDIDPRSWYAIPVYDSTHHWIWIREIDMLVPRYDIVFTNDPLTTLLFKEEKKVVMSVELKEREKLSGTEVRRRIINGEDWKSLVPKESAKMIEEIGIDRLRLCMKDDKSHN